MSIIMVIVIITMVIIAIMVIVQVPNFGQLMALVGASCCTLLAYIMPALCHLVLFRLKNDISNPFSRISYQKSFRRDSDQSGRLLDYTLLFLGVTFI